MISRNHQTLFKQVFCKDFGVFVNAPILDYGGWMIHQLMMGSKSVGQKENLGMKSPGLHIFIKIDQVGVLGNWFVIGIPTEVLR
jgi:hypothetical protein